VARVDHHPVGRAAPAQSALVVQPGDQLAGEADLDPIVAVCVDEFATVDPERRLAVELGGPLLDARQLRKPRQELLHASTPRETCRPVIADGRAGKAGTA
jgi:hypothetical protein